MKVFCQKTHIQMNKQFFEKLTLTEDIPSGIFDRRSKPLPFTIRMNGDY